MAIKDSENKSRFILERKAEKGEELQHFQEAQAELVNIQAEQRNLLERQGVLSNVDAQNNQTLAQAAEILADSESNAVGGTVITAPQQLKNNRAALSSLGVGQPKVTKSTKTVQTPNNVHITNNNITNNHNNIQLSQPSIPVASPVKTGGDGNAKFKAWLSNSFARQNEEAAIREREYQRKEWSLTRSANKIIKKMGELGKSFAERMDPKNIGNVFGDQLKVVLFMMGFQLLTQNFGKVADSVINFVGWMLGDKTNGNKNFFTRLKESIFGSDKDVSFSGLLQDLKDGIVSTLGGEKGETLTTAIKGLFEDFGTILEDKFTYFFESRGRAIKAVKFPELDLDKIDLSQAMGAVSGYLGDIMAAAFSGTDAVVESRTKNLLQKAKRSKLEEYDDKFSHTQDADHLIKNGGDVSIGAAVMKDSNFKENLKMAGSDYNSAGDLANNVESSVKLSQRLANITKYSKKVGGEVPTAELQAGLSDLKQSANRHGETLVSGDFLSTVGEALGIDQSMESLKDNLVEVPVKYIKVKKSEADLGYENAGSFTDSMVSSYLTRRLVDKVAGADSVYNIGHTYGKGNVVEGTVNLLASWLPWIGDEIAALNSGASNALRSLAKDGYTIKMVRADDPRYKDIRPVIGVDGTPMTDTFYSLTPSDMNFLENEVRKSMVNPNYSFDKISSLELKEFDKHLVKQLNEKSGGNSSSGLDTLGGELQDINSLAYQDRRAKAEMDRKHQQLRPHKSAENLKSGYNNVMNSITSWGENFTERLDNLFNLGKDYVPISDEEAKKNGIYIMGRLIKELGLTPTQAAGIVGNLYQESGLNPKAQAKGGDSGIAQWIYSSRIENFKHGKGDWKGSGGRLPHETDLKTQTDFLIWELKNEYPNELEKLKKSKNSKDAADVAFSRYVGGSFGSAQAGVEYYKKEIGVDVKLDNRRNFSEQFGQLYTSVNETGKSIQQTFEESPEVIDTLLLQDSSLKLLEGGVSEKEKGEKQDLELRKEILTEEEFFQHLKKTDPTQYGFYSGIEEYKKAHKTHEISKYPGLEDDSDRGGLYYLKLVLDANIGFKTFETTGQHGAVYPHPECSVMYDKSKSDDKYRTLRNHYIRETLIQVGYLLNILFNSYFSDKYTYGAIIKTDKKSNFINDLEKLKKKLGYRKGMSEGLLYKKIRSAIEEQKKANKDALSRVHTLSDGTINKMVADFEEDKLNTLKDIIVPKGSSEYKNGDEWLNFYDNAYRDINIAMEEHNLGVQEHNESVNKRRAEIEKDKIMYNSLSSGKSLEIDESGNYINIDKDTLRAAIESVRSEYNKTHDSTANLYISGNGLNSKDYNYVYDPKQGAFVFRRSTDSSEELSPLITKIKERYSYINSDEDALNKLLSLANEDPSRLSEEEKELQREIQIALLREHHKLTGGTLLSNVNNIGEIKALGDNFFSEIKGMTEEQKKNLNVEDDLVKSLTAKYFGIDYSSNETRVKDRETIIRAIQGDTAAFDIIRKTSNARAMATNATNTIKSELKPLRDPNFNGAEINLQTLVDKYTGAAANIRLMNIGDTTSSTYDKTVIEKMSPGQISTNTLNKLLDVENALATISSNILVLTGVEAAGINSNAKVTWESAAAVASSSAANNNQPVNTPSVIQPATPE